MSGDTKTGAAKAAKPAPALNFAAGPELELPPRPRPAPAPVAAAPVAAAPVAVAPAPAAAAVVARPPAQRQAPAPAAAAAKPARRKPRKRARSAADDGTGVSLPISLVDRMRHFTTRGAGVGRSYTEVTLDAVEATHERLAELLAPVMPEPRTGPLFAGRPARRAAHGEGHQQVNLRFGADDLAVIDDLWPRVGAPNRSAMLAAALGAYLPADRVSADRVPAE